MKYLLVAVTITMLGCSDRSGDPAPLIRYDSAGVEIVRLLEIPDPRDESSRWGLRLSRTFSSVSALDPTGDPVLYDPRDVIKGAGDTLVILDGGPDRFVVVDGSNTVAARFGATGQGPGEVLDGFANMVIAEPGMLVIADGANSRFSAFSLSGEFLFDTRFQLGIGRPIGWKVRLQEGEFFAHVSYIDNSVRNPEIRDSVGRLDFKTGKLEAAIGLPPRAPLPQGGRIGQVIFQPRTRWAVLPSGLFVVARNDQPYVEISDANGNLIRQVWFPFEAKKISELERRRVIAGYREAVGRSFPDIQPTMRGEFPLFNNIFSLGDSLFALQHSQFSSPAGDPPVATDQVRWRVFSTAGRFLGNVEFPDGFRPRHASDTEILGFQLDSLGLATIQQYLVEVP